MVHSVGRSSANRYKISRFFIAVVCFLLITTLWTSPAYAAVNTEPTLDPVSNLTVLEDSNPTTVLLTGISAGAGDVGQNLTVSASSSNLSILPNPTITYTSTETTGSLVFTPVQNMFGEVQVTVTVLDDGGTADGGDDSFSQTFSVTITPVNDPPLVFSFNKIGNRGNPLVFDKNDFQNNYSDIENSSLASIKIISLPTTGTLTFNGGTIPVETEIPVSMVDKLEFVPAFYWYGSNSFSWTASDGQDYSALSATVNLTYPLSVLSSYLPLIIAPPPPPPLAFIKTAPLNKATAQPINPLLDWQDSAGTTDYQYCYDTIINNNCEGSWISIGMTSQAQLTGLNYSTKYEWHVRAYNVGGTTYSNDIATSFYTFTTVPPPPWVKSFTENFEGAFPGPWQLFSGWYYEGSYYDVTADISWGKRNCHAASGSYGGWAVGGGSFGSGVSCKDSYLDDFESWMIYGPVDLSQVKDAWMSLKIWSDTESGYDRMGWGVSLDNDMFYGHTYTGNSGGWITDTIDLKNVYSIGNVTGASQVWIGIWFESDSSDINYEEGVAVDNLVLSTCLSVTGCTGTPLVTGTSKLPNTFQVMPTMRSLNKKGFQPSLDLPANFFFDPSVSWPRKLDRR